MIRLLKELVALVVVLTLGLGVALAIYTTAGSASSQYDTFQASVDSIPLQILSPAAGQVLSLSSTVGSTVTQGAELATIQVFDRTYRPPTGSQLMQLQGDKLVIVSPVTGIVGRIAIAPLSMVGGDQALLDVYAPEDTDLHVMIPIDKAISSYRAFFAATSLSGTRYPISMDGAIPLQTTANVAPKTTVFRATCARTADCLTFLSVQQLVVIAEKVASG